MTVCPCCGSEVDRTTLALDVDLADLRARIDMSPTPGRVFLILFDAMGDGQSTGRILSVQSILDALEIRARQSSTEEGIKHAFKRITEAVRALRWPVRLHNVHGIGWRIERKRGWHWRDEPTTLQRQIAADEFQL